MTSIALLNTKVSPLLVSDMLLSRERMSDDLNDVYVPTLGNLGLVEKFVGARLPFEVTRMVRKPFVVNEHLHVAWAGDLSAGTALRASLMRLTAEGCGVIEAIDEAMARLSIDQQKGASLIAIELPIATSSGRWRESIVVHERRCLTLNSPLWGTCYFGGSGAEDLMTWVSARDKHWHDAFKEFSDERLLISELMVAHLVFGESLLSTQEQNKQFSSLLSNGCGGFYEVNRFVPGGVAVPRPALHLNIRVKADGSFSITRIYLYHTKIREQGGRAALISSFDVEPNNVPLDVEYFSFFVSHVDVVMCPPFWSDIDLKEQIHMRDDPALLFLDARGHEPVVVTLSIFEESGEPQDTAIADLALDVQLKVLEGRGSRRQTFVELMDEAQPQVLLDVDEGEFAIHLCTSFLSRNVDRFVLSGSKPGHVVT